MSARWNYPAGSMNEPQSQRGEVSVGCRAPRQGGQR